MNTNRNKKIRLVKGDIPDEMKNITNFLKSSTYVGPNSIPTEILHLIKDNMNMFKNIGHFLAYFWTFDMNVNFLS